jgi:hypothetical protein
MKNAVFWDVTPHGSCKNQRLGGKYRFRYQGDKNRPGRNNFPSSLIPATLMMEAIRSSEASVLKRATRRNIQDDGILHKVRNITGHMRWKNSTNFEDSVSFYNLFWIQDPTITNSGARLHNWILVPVIHAVLYRTGADLPPYRHQNVNYILGQAVRLWSTKWEGIHKQNIFHTFWATGQVAFQNPQINPNPR